MDTLFEGDNDNKINQWSNFLEKLDTHVSDQVSENSSKWFSKKNITLKSLIREDANGNIFVKWIINLKTNIFVDNMKNSFNPANLKENDTVRLIAEVSNLWISDDKCGLAIVVHKIMVNPYLEKPDVEYVFNETESEDLNDDDDNSIISLFATEQKIKQPQHQSANFDNQQPKQVKKQTEYNDDFNISFLEQKQRGHKQSQNDNTQKKQVKVRFEENFANEQPISKNTHIKSHTGYSKDDDILEISPDNNKMTRANKHTFVPHPEKQKNSKKIIDDNLYSSEEINEDDLDFN